MMEISMKRERTRMPWGTRPMASRYHRRISSNHYKIRKPCNVFRIYGAARRK
jgi:hypothetical protein